MFAKQNPTQQHRIVVLGAGYAGMVAAYRLAGKTKVHITLVNASDVFVERIRLHQMSAGQRIRQSRIQNMLRGTRIKFVQGRVTAIQPDKRKVSVKIVGSEQSASKQSGSEQTLDYDTLVYTLGSFTDQDRVPGIRENAHVLSDESAANLRQRLAALPAGGQLVVCGGGLTGIESATEFAEAYPNVRVSLLTEGTFGADLSKKGQAYLRKVFDRLKITVQDRTRIKRIDAGGVITENGAFGFDVCLWAGPFAVSPLARDAQIATNVRGQILVDAHMRSISHTDIYAAGDSATFADYLFPIRMACATALPMGMSVADSVAAMLNGTKPEPFRFGYMLRCISLGRHDALAQMVEADDRAIDKIYTGRLGALIKESLCQYSLFNIRFEHYFPGIFRQPVPHGVTKEVKRSSHGVI